MSKLSKIINLRRLILLLCIVSVVATLLNTFNSGYLVNREQLIENTIEANRAYAKKMADMTNTFIKASMSQLKYSANVLSAGMNNQRIMDAEVDRLQKQTDSFNSVAIVNPQGVIVAISPETVGIKGVKLKQKELLRQIKEPSPFVSEPVVSPAGNYLIGLSYPIYSKSGQFIGYLFGTIYLEQENALTALLGDHAYKDGSYLYVVNHQHTIISHPDFSRVGDVIESNDAIEALSHDESGGGIITNSIGIEMLTGYAPVPDSGWGIVVQRPESRALKKLDEQMGKVWIEALPIVVLTLVLIWIFAFLISKPLWQLANSVSMFESNTPIDNELRKVKPWYFEASNLKLSVTKTLARVTNKINKLNKESLTDRMTGLLNRRGLENAIEQIENRGISIAVLVLDIDYFKKINDTFGHDIGDEVLKEVARILKSQARDDDVLIRFGGEEFIILLTSTDINKAFEVAERIRTSIESHQFNTVEHITISIGVSTRENKEQTIFECITHADQALYKAKNGGRNKTEVL